MSMPATKRVPLPSPKHPAKTNNPHPRHEHTEFHAPREGLNKAAHQGSKGKKK